MKKHFLKKHEENWLRIPYEENADPCIITISDSTGKKETIQMKVSKTRVDYWMAYPLKDFFGDDIQAEGPASRWINAIELSDDPEKQRRRELSKSVIQYMPPTGCIRELNSVKKAGEQWVLDCVTDPCSLTGNEENQTAMRLVSKDLLHWKSEENELEEIEINCRFSPEQRRQAADFIRSGGSSEYEFPVGRDSKATLQIMLPAEFLHDPQICTVSRRPESRTEPSAAEIKQQKV